MFDKEAFEKDMKVLARLRARMPEDDLKRIDQEVENRLQLHLLQKPEWSPLTSDVVGGKHLFGVIYRPRNMDEPYRCEANYVLAEAVSKDGKPMIERRQGLVDRSKTIWALVNPNDYEATMQ
mgnify:CR=1 FL=1